MQAHDQVPMREITSASATTSIPLGGPSTSVHNGLSPVAERGATHVDDLLSQVAAAGTTASSTLGGEADTTTRTTELGATNTGDNGVNGTVIAAKPVQSARDPPRSSSPLSKSLAHHLAQNPTHSAGQAMRQLYPKANPFSRLAHRFQVKHSVIAGMTAKEFEVWEKRGPELRRKAGWKLSDDDAEGAPVSDLFWKMYLSLMPTLERDPLAGMTTPDLLGSTTTMPLSIISLIPDIIKHFYDVIVRAQKEVFIATNYWQPSNSVSTVSKALRDLSARVVKEGREKVIVKLMYDRGSWEQLWNAHAPVETAGWSPLDLPTVEEIPGLDMEVINFHKVLLGTFHAKLIIVDRKVALLSSNNIQDRPNLEMMTHLEGPVVDSFYDVALHSWYNRLSPPLPCLQTPYEPPRDADGEVRYLFRDHNPFFRDIETLKAARAARKLLRLQTKDIDDERARHLEELHAHPTRDRIDGLVEAVRQAMANQRQNVAQNVQHAQEEIAARGAKTMKELRGLGERMGITTSRPTSRRGSMSDLTALRGEYDKETAAMTAQNARIGHEGAAAPASEATGPPALHDVPVKSKTMPAEVGRYASFQTDNESDYGTATANTSQRQSFHSAREDVADTSAGNANGNAANGITDDGSPFTASPRASLDEPAESSAAGAAAATSASGDMPESSAKLNKPHLTMSIPTDASGTRTPKSFRWNDDLDSPYSRKVSIDVADIPPEGGTKRMYKLSKRFNAGALSEAWATVEDSDELDNFRPHVIHAPHKPFPVAMACRRPQGMPGHQDIRNPQNAAWLAGCRYAQRQVFIQTPTLNARPIVRAIKQACRRGVEVVLLLDLGFNDKGESIPFQGGTNEQVVDRLYKKLGPEGKAKFLKVYWYTGKDQIRPLNAVKKQRNCHIKLAIFDDEVAVLGNGNQDTQSWFHSQEINVMIDSKQVVKELRETLLANQNTMQYGGVDEDGVWRDDEGHTLEHYGATGGGGFLGGISAFITFAKTAAK